MTIVERPDSPAVEVDERGDDIPWGLASPMRVRKRDGALIRCLDAREDAKERRLADAVRTDDADAASRRDRDRHAVENEHLSVGLAHAARDERPAGAGHVLTTSWGRDEGKEIGQRARIERGSRPARIVLVRPQGR